MGTQLHVPALKGHRPTAPNFRSMSVVAKRLDGLLGVEAGLGPGDVVLDGVAAPP